MDGSVWQVSIVVPDAIPQIVDNHLPGSGVNGRTTYFEPESRQGNCSYTRATMEDELPCFRSLYRCVISLFRFCEVQG